MTDLEAAWDELPDAKPDGCFVGPPTHEEHRHEWTTYAFDTREWAKCEHRSPKWTAVAQSELEVVHEMARCLRLIREERVPGSSKAPLRFWPADPGSSRRVRAGARRG